MDTCNNIVQIGMTADMANTLPGGARSLVQGLLEKDALKRLPLKKALAHPWVLDQCELRAKAKAGNSTKHLGNDTPGTADAIPPTATLVVPLMTPGGSGSKQAELTVQKPAAGYTAESSATQTFFIGTTPDLQDAVPSMSRGCLMSFGPAEAPMHTTGEIDARPPRSELLLFPNADAVAPPVTAVIAPQERTIPPQTFTGSPVEAIPKRSPPPQTYERVYLEAAGRDDAEPPAPFGDWALPRIVRPSGGGPMAKARSAAAAAIVADRAVAAAEAAEVAQAIAAAEAADAAEAAARRDAAGGTAGWFKDALKYVGMDGRFGEAQPEGAGAPTLQQQQLLAELTSLGFSREQAQEAVKRTSSIEAAVEWILQKGGPA